MKTLLLLLIFLTPIIAYAQCETVEDGMVINSDTVLCKNTYNIENGIIVNADNIILDCDNSKIIGPEIGYGVLLRNRTDVWVKNCNIDNFEIGIYLEYSTSNDLTNNIISNNKFGIASYSSEDNNLRDNEITNSSRSNIITATVPLLEQEQIIKEKEEEKEIEIAPEQILQESIKIKNPDLREEEIIAELDDLLDKHFKTQENLVIERTFFYNETEDSTTITLKIIPKKILYNFSLYENIPKCVAEYLDLIVFANKDFEIINKEPLIVWHFATVKEELGVSYKVYKKISEECKKLLVAIGVADSFDEFSEENPARNIFKIVLIIVLVIIILVFLNKFKKR